MGNFVVESADASQVAVPIRYGVEALPLRGDELPLPKLGESWLIWRKKDEEHLQKLLVREWVNPNPTEPILRLRFVPAIHAAEVGLQILAITVSQ